MKLKDLPPKALISKVKVRVPQDGSIKQLTDNPIKEGWIVSMFAHPGGWFMSADPPEMKTRHLIPTYGENNSILGWDIAEDVQFITEDGILKTFIAENSEV